MTSSKQLRDGLIRFLAPKSTSVTLTLSCGIRTLTVSLGLPSVILTLSESFTRPPAKRGVAESDSSSSASPGEKPASFSHSPARDTVESLEVSTIPPGDSQEGQDGWRYMVTEAYMMELLGRVAKGEAIWHVMLELWSEAEDAA